MISLIAAVAKDNVIGKAGKLPWNLPEDLKHFRDLTIGKTVLMGKTTWESLPEKLRPLPGRKNVVVALEADYQVPAGVELFHDLGAALASHADEKVMVMGGASIYRQTIGLADTLYITHLDLTVEGGDAFFPAIDPSVWREVSREEGEGMAWVTYKRRV
ncbi:dihydrofolate reductase [Patescibacteria group bacterium]|nr:MAG: dihydrofolate reductase [Patescibacteria group bacterium]